MKLMKFILTYRNSFTSWFVRQFESKLGPIILHLHGIDKSRKNIQRQNIEKYWARRAVRLAESENGLCLKSAKWKTPILANHLIEKSGKRKWPWKMELNSEDGPRGNSDILGLRMVVQGIYDQMLHGFHQRPPKTKHKPGKFELG